MSMLAVRDVADWLDTDVTLTPTELRILRVLASRFGRWVPGLAILRAVYRDYHHRDVVAAEMHALRSHLVRIRRKLVDTPYRVENHYFHGEYRLVHVSVACSVQEQSGNNAVSARSVR